MAYLLTMLVYITIIRVDFPGNPPGLEDRDTHMKRPVVAVMCAACVSLTNADTNDTRTIKEVVQAAERGDVKSQAMAGWMYAAGDGVQQNYREAYHWLTKAAEKGNADAQFNLGVMYENGFLVQQSHQVAAKLFRQAAEQDHEDAIKRLSALYMTGKIPMDLQENKKWFEKSLSIHQKDPQADFAKIVAVSGTKICNEATGSMSQYARYTVYGKPQYQQTPGEILVTGFTEGVSGKNLQIRVASIKHRDLSSKGRETILTEMNYNDTTIRPNSVFWDDLRNWKPC